MREDWGETIRKLEGLGVRAAAEAAAAAAEAGCTPADFEPHIEWWLRRRGLWRRPEGVLFHRLRRLRPGQSPTDHWPPFDPDLEQRRRRDRDRQKPDASEQLRRKYEREEEQRRRREAVRPLLEAMSPEERNAFALQTITQ
ncbi:hypothetical protein [Botrimarina sp.]|uniref:hypothetical protein n=1 Tax=Botrimarina sp. TaxID=2795802 RepID=UPI0032EEF65E